MTSLPITVGAVPIPAGARLRLTTLTGVRFPYIADVPVFTSGAPDASAVPPPPPPPPTAGALLAVVLAGASSDLSFLEGQVRAVIDGELVVLSSGTEDYFLSGQYFDLGTYATPGAGCTSIDRVGSAFSAWRLHEEDPVVWSAGIALTWRIGEARIKANATNVTTYAWAYVWDPAAAGA